MSLKILSYLFTGPFELESAKVRSNQDPVVFAIVCRGGQPWNPEFSLIDVDTSAPEGITFEDHPKLEEWRSNCGGSTGVYFLPFSRIEVKNNDPRPAVVKEIRDALRPPGGSIPIHGMM